MACSQVVFPLRVTVAGATFESGSLSIPIVLQLLIQTQLLRTRFVRGIRTMFGEHCKFVYTNVEKINPLGLDIHRPATAIGFWFPDIVQQKLGKFDHSQYLSIPK